MLFFYFVHVRKLSYPLQSSRLNKPNSISLASETIFSYPLNSYCFSSRLSSSLTSSLKRQCAILQLRPHQHHTEQNNDLLCFTSNTPVNIFLTATSAIFATELHCQLIQNLWPTITEFAGPSPLHLSCCVAAHLTRCFVFKNLIFPSYVQYSVFVFIKFHLIHVSSLNY